MIPFLKGERLYLRPLVESDADGDYPFWFNDADVCAGNSHYAYPYRYEQSRDYIAYASTPQAGLVLAICIYDSGLHIGNIALQSIHPLYHSAEFAIVIGNQDYWHGGFGTEAARLIINHGFDELNLHRVACATFSNNIAMQKLAKKLNMRLEGVRIAAAYKGGAWLDVLEYGVLRHEW